MAERYIERMLEWEWAANGPVIEHVAFPNPPFVRGTHKLTISRSDDLKLQLLTEGTTDEEELFRFMKADDRSLAGTIIEPVDVSFEAHGTQYRLQGHLNDPNFSLSAQGRPFSQTGSPSGFFRKSSTRPAGTADNDITFAPLGSAAWRSDWFINGPHHEISIRFTKRRRTSSYLRNEVCVEGVPSGSDSRDHILVETEDLRFSVGEVPKPFAPAWARPIRIDFFAPIPQEDTREAVAEILSFIVGRRLMRVGSTLFDTSGWAIEQEVRNPWGQGIQNLCKNGVVAPIPTTPFTGELEALLKELVPKYVSARTQMKDALLTYWLGAEAVSGVNLALYGSAVEALKNTWFASSKSKSAGAYMPAPKFNETFGDLVEQFRSRLVDLGLSSAIANKVAKSYQMGSGEQLTEFLKELSLPVGQSVKDAIKARNSPVHGGLKGGADQRELLRHANAYRVLFERTFLKMLDYNGRYVDRTTLGHPSRPIAEPEGGEDVSPDPH